MNWVHAGRVFVHIINWRLHWGRYDTHYRLAVPGNPKFMGAREAVTSLIKDGDVVAVSGLGSNQWVSILYWSMRALYQETGHPKDLTFVAIGGQGARGKAPGSLEEVGLPGLVTRFFSGHMETFKSILKLADAGHCELQCMPQGRMASVLEAQGRGEDSVLSVAGLGTFMDPRVGRGTPLVPANAPQYVSVEDDKLRYTLPKVNVAMWNAPAADRDGNIYLKHGSMIAEIPEITRAARANGGRVIANVGLLVDKGYGDVLMPADMVDAVVVYPDTEQVGSVKHRKYWPLFTTEGDEGDITATEGAELLQFANEIVGITPRRTKQEFAMARMAASLFSEEVYKGSLVNIGVGLPEVVCRLVVAAGLRDEVTFFAESGVIGGLPAPGVFFGAALCPRKMVSSAEIFRMCYEHLDVSILGALQVDGAGNVNVSKRGEGAINYVGPGGFMDFVTAARTIIFITSWMHGGKVRLQQGRVRIVERGKPKFVERVDEITFSGQRALEAGKRVFYVSNVGVFQLTRRGMELVRVAPGIDVQRDIVAYAPMRVILPAGPVPVADKTTVTGRGFTLALRDRPADLPKNMAV